MTTNIWIIKNIKMHEIKWALIKLTRNDNFTVGIYSLKLNIYSIESLKLKKCM